MAAWPSVLPGEGSIIDLDDLDDWNDEGGGLEMEHGDSGDGSAMQVAPPALPAEATAPPPPSASPIAATPHEDRQAPLLPEATPVGKSRRPLPSGGSTTATAAVAQLPPAKRGRSSAVAVPPRLRESDREAPSRAPSAAAGAAAAIKLPAAPQEWRRPRLPPLSQQSPLAFFLLSVDNYQGPGTSGPRRGRSPVGPPGGGGGSPSGLQLHGVTREGNSVLLHAHGFTPYFYARKPPGQAPPEAFKKALDGFSVVAIREVSKRSLMNFQPKAEAFLQIHLASPKQITSCRSAVEKGLRLPDGTLWQSSTTFEGNVSFPLRFLVDAGLGGGSWLEVAGGSYTVRDPQDHISTAQLEVDAKWSDLKGLKAEGEWLGLPPLRLLSLHLRAARADGPIVACATVLQVHGEEKPRRRTVWVAQQPGSTVGVISGAEVVPCSEDELLKSLREYIVTADVDVVLGYGLINDKSGMLSALLGRVDALGLKGYALGRFPALASQSKGQTFDSRQQGRHDRVVVNAEGRLIFDVLLVWEVEHKLSSYSLSALATHFLGESRLELRAAKVEQLSRENPSQLGAMALRDADLSLRLFHKQQCLFRFVEMARVTGVPMEYLLQRGQSIKVFSMLLRKARMHDFVIPATARGPTAEESTYEGGAVFDPLAGFYDEPVVTLDFASLYPSIMQRYNLCYTTLMLPGDPAPSLPSSAAAGATAVDEVPTLGHRFVTSAVRKGVLPMVLKELLDARAVAKKAMKSTTDPQMKAVLDGRQFALKLSANSVYGFTGMGQSGPLPCQAIAASVTAYGRAMIEKSKDVVESHFCKANNFKVDAKVIYGDTDSVMVTLGRGFPLEDAFKFGHEAAELVSREFGAPVKMEFEKVYFPYLLMTKKRYAGLNWQRPEKPEKLDMKGIESQRRDWCELVRHVVENCLNLLLRERAQEAAIAYVQETVAKLRQGRLDLRLLVTSKGLTRDSAESYNSKQVHVELAQKLRGRDPVSAPQIGQRVPYIIMADHAAVPLYQRGEDPLFALEKNVPVDADYYIDHQLKEPLLRIFQPVLEGVMNADAVEQKLFAGDHARRSTRTAVTGTGPLSAFVRRRAKCIGCKELLDSPEGVLCAACGDPDKVQEVVLSQLATLGPLEAEVSRIYSQCASCEGSSLGGLLADCANVDCPIFCRRHRASEELATLRETMASLRRISLDW